MRQASILGGLLAMLMIALPVKAHAHTDWSCPKGSVLVGFEGYPGVWNDNLTPLCAPWELDHGGHVGVTPGPGKHDTFGRIIQSVQRREICDANEAVTAVRFGFAKPNDQDVHLQNLQIQCTNVVTHITSGTWHAELAPDNGASTAGDQCTEANTVANGIAIDLIGRAGGYNIVGLALKCVVSSQIMADASPAPWETIDPHKLPPLAVADQDRPGGEMVAFNVSGGVENPDECYRRCAGIQGCKAWTYVKKGVRYPQLGYCSIKDGVPAPKPNACCVSGVAAPKFSQVETDRPGSDIANFALSDTDPNLCADACAKNAQCKAWTYTNPGVHGMAGAHCYLKNPAPAPKSDKCCVSGVRVAIGTSAGQASNTGSAQETPPNVVIHRPRRGAPAQGEIDQTFSIACNSSGEACDTPAAVNLPDGAWSIRVTAPPAHCSPIDYRLTTDNHGDLIGDTGPLAPGQSSALMTVPSTAKQVYISATGVRGGCNTGSLKSWGIEVKLTPR